MSWPPPPRPPELTESKHLYENVEKCKCEWLVKRVIVHLAVSHYMDNQGSSRANTCAQSQLCGRLCLLGTEPAKAPCEYPLEGQSGAINFVSVFLSFSVS